MNLITMRNAARSYLLESGTQNFFTDDDINGGINMAYMQYAMKIMAKKEQLFMSQATIDFVAGQNNYALPADFKREIRVNRVYNGITQPLQRRHRYNEPMLLAGAAAIYPTWDRYNNDIIFEPAPAYTETGSVILDYIAQPIRLVQDTDTPNAAFPDMYHDLLVLRAVVMGLMKERDAEGASMFAAQINDLEEDFNNSFELDEERSFTRSFFNATGDNAGWF